MIKRLKIFTTLFFLSSFALAQEEVSKFQLLPKDVYFQPGGGVRVRYDNLRAATGGAFPANESEAQITHRAQIDLSLYKGEYFESHFKLINFARWGAGGAANSLPGQPDAFDRSNSLLVNQAFARWKINESLGMRFGRAPLHIGLGFTYGSNDWFDTPYSFDLIEVSWDWPALKASLIAAQVLDLSKVEGETLSQNPSETHVIFSFDIKNVHEAVSQANFSLIQANRDLGSPDQGATVLNGLNMQRAAFDAEIKGKNIFAQGFFTFVTGEERIAPINQVSGVDKRQINQFAYDFKLGYNFTESNNLRFWAGYHMDSGDDELGVGAAKSFDSFYYEVYGQAGLMDLLRWGNLNFIRTGFDVDFSQTFKVGLEYLSFNKTEAVDNLNFGQAGRFLNSRIVDGDLTLGSSREVGQEIDLWADWNFESGVKVRTTLSSFMPGPAFEQSTSSESLPNSTIFQFLSQVGYFF